MRYRISAGRRLSGPCPSARKGDQQPRDQCAARRERHAAYHQRRHQRGDQRQHRERDIDGGHTRDHLRHGETVVERALVEMAAVRLPDPLAPRHATAERDGGVGEVVERQQDRRGEMAAARHLQQQPADQQADRQAADVAEEQPRHRLVERGEAEHGAKQRARDQRRQDADAGIERQQHDRAGDRHDLGHRHPVDAVHEVEQVDEPHAAEKQERAIEPLRHLRHRLKFMRQRGDHDADRQALGRQPDRRRQGADIVETADQGQQHRRRGDRIELPRQIAEHRLRQHDRAPDRGQRRRHDRDAAALRGRLTMRRAGIRAGERMSRQRRPDQHDQQQAQRECAQRHHRQDQQRLERIGDHDAAPGPRPSSRS